jgi:hypothetical protein
VVEVGLLEELVAVAQVKRGRERPQRRHGSDRKPDASKVDLEEAPPPGEVGECQEKAGMSGRQMSLWFDLTNRLFENPTKLV